MPRGGWASWDIVREKVRQLSIRLRVRDWNKSGRKAVVHPLALPESVAVKEAANPSSYLGTFSSASSAQQVKVAAELSTTVSFVSL